MYFEGPNYLSRSLNIIVCTCEDPNFVISVAYKIQFGSKVNELLLELDTTSSVAFKTARSINTTTTRLPREISWIFFCYSPLVVGVLSILFHNFILFFFIFNFSFCGFKISFSFSWVASLGIRVILPRCDQ